MDYRQVPLGFGMALSRNPQAMNTYFAMTEEQKKAILEKANHALSENEMHRIIDSLITSRMH